MQREITGPGCIAECPAIVKALSVKKLLIICDDGSRRALDENGPLSGLAASYAVTKITLRGLYPRIDEVRESAARYKNTRPDAVIALGPWYIIEAAKLINLFGNSPLSVDEHVNAGSFVITGPVAPLIAVPTAPAVVGATRSADLYIDTALRTITDDILLPAVAIIDPGLMAGGDTGTLATGAMYALTTAIESYWSVTSTDESRGLAGEAIRAIAEHFPGAIRTADPAALTALATAALRAGRAADIAGANACRGLAHSLYAVHGITPDRGAPFFLREMIAFNSDFSKHDSQDPRGADFALGIMNELHRLLGGKDAKDSGETIKKFMSAGGLPVTLSAMGISITDDFKALLDRVNFEFVRRNPRPLKDASLRIVLRNVRGISPWKRIKMALLPYYETALDLLAAVRSIPVTVSMLVEKLKGRKVVVIEGEITLLQYIHPVIEALVKKGGAITYYIAVKDLFRESPELDIFDHIEKKRFSITFVRKLFLTDLFISAYILGIGPKQALRLHIFHNLPVKHESYAADEFINFDAHFVLGDLNKLMIDTTVKKHGLDRKKFRLLRVGYPKSDALIRGDYDRASILAGLGLDPALPTVLYSPSWDDGMSLRSYGAKIFDAILTENVNLIVKLHPLSYSPREHPLFYNYTGGVDWAAVIKKYEGRPNFKHVVSVRNINPLLAASDIMVTDLSSVALEFIMLDRPVLYIECPDFFNRVLPKNYAGMGNIDSDFIKSNPLTNAGRHVGLVVEHIDDLPKYIRRSIDDPDELSPKRKEFAAQLLYNPGGASEIAAQSITGLLFSAKGTKIFNEI